MKFKRLGVILLACLGFVEIAHANKVLLTANQPMKITFRVAHKNPNNQPVFGQLQSIAVNKNVNVPVSLNNYDRAGIVIISIDGHELPESANQFDQPEQCSMTTDRTKTMGTIELILSKHSINCRSYGGIFG